MTENISKSGRPAVPEEHKRNKRAISTTDAEWHKLSELAAAAGLSISQYVVKKLKLS